MTVWPDGKRFAFTVFDDTDLMTLANGRPVYDLLTDLGLRVTKSVWPLAPDGPGRVGGTTCADADYLRWAQGLQASGHEIGIHNASDRPSRRARTIEGLDRFRDLFGHDPRVGADHAGNTEALYWGPRRLSGVRARMYDGFEKVLKPHRTGYSGDQPTSEFFWGDECRARIDYWRNFTFSSIDVLDPCPMLPYHDAQRPYVRWWFGSTHAPTARHVVEALSTERLDALEASGGVCILYTHFGAGGARDGVVDPGVRARLEDLAARPGWFAPVSDVLDHLRATGHGGVLDDGARRRMEWRWVSDQTRSRGAREVARRLPFRR